MKCTLRGMTLSTVVAAVALLTGCASTASPDAADSPTTVTVPDATSAAVTPLPPGTEVAAAVFSARDGFSASGSLTVLAGEEPGSFEIVTRDLDGPAGAELTLLPYPIDDAATCADTGFRFSLGSLDSLGPGPHLLMSDLTQGDPSFFDSAVFTVYSDADREQNDCLATVVAAAPLVWTLSPGRPGLEAVDSGPRSGASGAVETDASGVPARYTVAAGDTLSGIAERFGITVDDLFFLNPARVPAPQDPLAYTDEVLNLTPSGR